MSFTWTQTIGVGSKSIKAALDEIRTNTDWLNNNRNYCGTNYTTHYPAHRITHNAVYYSSNNNTNKTTHNSSNYTSYCPYDSGGTCFPMGVKILMSSGRWMSIEDVRPGDKVMSFYGKENTVLEIDLTRLGDNRAMYGFPDGSLIFSPEEYLWAKNGSDEFWSVSDYSSYLREKGMDWVINGKLYKRYGLKRREPIIQVFALDYAHITGWKKHMPVVRREFGSDTPLYSLVLDGDYTYFVNGYITAGGVSDEVIDFSTYKWKGLDVEIDAPYYCPEVFFVRGE